MSDENYYNPNDHTVAEVQEYLATADDAERARVLDAEQDGQRRVGIVGQPAAADGVPTTADATVPIHAGSVNQAEADADAARRNAELVEQGTLSDRGYIGSDASDLQG